MADSDKALGVVTTIPDPLSGDGNKTGIIVIISLIVLLLLVIVVWIYMRTKSNKNYYKSTVFHRFEEFSKLSVSKFTLTLVMAYLVAAIVFGFNKSIMIPIVQSILPSEDIWGQGVSLPRGAVMYPGLFFILVVSFFLSMMVVFILAELIYQMVKLLTRGGEKMTKIVGVCVLVGLLLGLMIWNVYDLKNSGEVHVSTIPPNIITSDMKRSRKEIKTEIKKEIGDYKKLMNMASF